MTDIRKIDYSAWQDKFKSVAEQFDKDGVKGLNGKEIFDFAFELIRNYKSELSEKENFLELMGVSLSQTRAAGKAKAPAKAAERDYSYDFWAAMDYYNKKMTPEQKQKITQDTYEIGYEILYQMEKAIDNAYIECKAYQDINITPSKHRYYRYYQNLDRLMNFDLDELRRMTAEDMESLYVLKDNVQKAIEDANGYTEHTEPAKTDYDVDKIAEKYLKPKGYNSYEEFAAKNRAELDFCKTVTSADISNMTDKQREVYSIAKAYATEMLNITINEAHTVRWDTGEQIQEETSKFLDDMYDISDFEYNTITDEGLANIESDIMFRAFEEALIKGARTGINSVEKEADGTIKRIVNGRVIISYPDRVIDVDGRRVN